MILGYLSSNPGANIPSALRNIREWNVSGDVTFYRISHSGFEGGYFINRRLPYREPDLCYYDECNDILVLLSGRIYNKSEFFSICNKTKSVPDPELIACLFLLEGPGFAEKLNGDFVIFILQPSKKEAYLFRDHLGICPLAYISDSQGLYFSSDINGLCRAFSDSRGVDSDYLLGYFKYIDYRKTPNDRVKKLFPGHFLHLAGNHIEFTKYWDPEKVKVDKTLSHPRVLADLKSTLMDAVRIRCDNHYRAGAHVSSGIDSGIVAVMARKEFPQQKPFYGFSWSPADFSHPDVQFDERDLVRKLCQKADILPLFSDIVKSDFSDIVSSFADNHGFFSEAGTIHQAVDAGVNLIFSGWGGDEFISTAAAAIEPDLLRSLKLCLYLKRNQFSHPRKFIKNVLAYVLMPALGILDRSTSGSFKDDARYLKEPFKKSDKKAIRQFYFHTSRHSHHIGMLNFYHLQNRCEKLYVMGFRNGVEYRYPLLDKRIIEYMLKVPSELLCTTDYSRPLLREISDGILPDEVRLNKSKNDPVYWTWMDELFKSSAARFMDEVDAWRSNPDLGFVDFNLLAENIARYKSQTLNIDPKVLFRALVYLKAIHEFTVTYRKKLDE